jgi:hypothetical protein
MAEPREPSEKPDEEMTQKEREAFVDQTEEFEGPDRREIRGEHQEPTNDPGVAHS